ncbi:MAG: hypothetical protein RBR14_06595 [Candidatus Cloacimonas acidaminovorans]|nr:hypothetical protein [Candidatus Cloacimonas acidaminovorans]
MKEFTIKHPDAPATPKQLYALFLATGEDHRDKGLTIQQASDMLKKIAIPRPNKNTSDEIYNYLISQWDFIYEKFLDEISIKSTLHFDISGDKRQYIFLGSGCGYAWVKYDKRSPVQRILFENDIFYSAIIRFRNEFPKRLDPQIKKELEMYGNPAGAIISQNRVMDVTIKSIALNYCINKFKLKNCYLLSRMD